VHSVRQIDVQSGCGAARLQPVRGLLPVEPRWRQEAERFVRAGAPGGSGGSSSGALRNFGGGDTRCGAGGQVGWTLDAQWPRPTGSCCLIGSASRRPMNFMERGMAKQDRAGVCIHRLAHAPQLIGQGQRFRNSHRPPARWASASSGVSTATQGRSKNSNTRARLPPRLRSSAHFSRACWLNCMGERSCRGGCDQRQGLGCSP
jgi:hypothetical protein